MIRIDMDLVVLTSEKTLLNEKVSLVRLPGVDGSFTILKNHAPIIAKLKKGAIQYISENSAERKKLLIEGGLVRVFDNKILVLVDI